MSKQKLERVLQLMINEENEKASDLLHDIFVEKARNIYSDMIKEDEDLEKSLRDYDEDDFDISDMEDDFEDDIGSELDTFDDEIDNEEMLEAEDEDEFDDNDDEDMDGEEDIDFDMEVDDMDVDDMDVDSEDEPDSAEEAFMDVDKALDELKAYFDELVGDDEDEDEEFSPEDEYDYDDDDEEEDDDEGGVEDLEDEFGDEEEDEDEDKLKESAELKKYGEPKSSKEADHKKTIFDKKIDRGENPKGVPNFQQSEEKGGTPPKPKDLGVDGPQENAGKLRKMKG